VAAAVSGQKDDFTARQPPGQQSVGRRAEGGFDLHPFLTVETLDVIKAAAANDTDAMCGHTCVNATRRAELVASALKRKGRRM
jgi:hypothetical protein